MNNTTEFTGTEWERIVLKYNLHILSPVQNITIGLYLLILGIMATFGNLLVIHVIYKSKLMWKNSQNLLILNLAVADIGISVFGYPMTMASSFANRFLFGEVGCVIQGFMQFTLALTSMNTMCCLSVYRYITVCLPHLRWRLSSTFTKKVIGLMWGYAIFWTGLPLVGCSSYVFEPFGTSCSVNWVHTTPIGILYTHGLIIFCYIINIAIIAWCYYNVIATSKAINKRIAACNEVQTPNNLAMEAKSLAQERKATVMSLAMVISFAVIWFPYTLLSLLASYNIAIPASVTVLPTMSCKSSCMINPVIYTLFNSEFRKHIRLLFRRKNKVGDDNVPPVNRRETNAEGIYVGRAGPSCETDKEVFF